MLSSLTSAMQSNLRRGKTVQVDLGIARFERTQQVLVIADLQVGMQPPLEEDSGAPEREHFIDLGVNLFEGKDVTVFRAERAVKGTEGAVFGAEVCVIDVAVDLVSDDPWIVFLQAQLVGGHTDGDQVVRLEHFEGLLFSDPHV